MPQLSFIDGARPKHRSHKAGKATHGVLDACGPFCCEVVIHVSEQRYLEDTECKMTDHLANSFPSIYRGRIPEWASVMLSDEDLAVMLDGHVQESLMARQHRNPSESRIDVSFPHVRNLSSRFSDGLGHLQQATQPITAQLLRGDTQLIDMRSSAVVNGPDLHRTVSPNTLLPREASGN